MSAPTDEKVWDTITPKCWDDYHARRLTEINGVDEDEDRDADLEPEEPRGDRAVDLERNTLNNAYNPAFRKTLVTSNPAKELPKFRPTTAVRHCREFKPEPAVTFIMLFK